MAIYFITGSLGAGKTLAGVMKVDEYLRSRKKIATNVNLNLEYLCSPDNDYSRVTRISDAPSLDELRAIGYGSEDDTGRSNGLLLLDELGTWFNARDFQNKDRLKVLKHIIHLRKLRWDVMFLVQDFSMVDKQMRGNITQFLVTCQTSKDHFLFKLLPQFQIATVRLRSKLKVDTWIYKSKHLFPAYDTEQRYFTDDEDDQDYEITAALLSPEMAAKEAHYRELNVPHSLLPPAYWDDESRIEMRTRHKATYVKRVQIAALLTLCVGSILMLFGGEKDSYALQPEEALPSDEEVLTVVQEVEELPIQNVFEDLRIVSYVAGRYGFQNSQNDFLSQRDLEDWGFKVRNRGRDEALIVDTDFSYYTVTK